jgi:hypothetical protein
MDVHLDFTLYQITNIMELSTSWEANSCSATQEILSILWKLKVHYRRVYKSPPVISLEQNESYLIKIQFIIILPSVPRSS